ncbi:recombinase family protein [Kitasatospora sp. NPDC003701]
MDPKLTLALDPKSGPCADCPPPGSPEVDLYCRKSASVSGRRRETSTDVQREIGHDWAHENGFRVRFVWRDILSAFKDIERPGFKHVMAALVKQEVPAGWVYKLDRFSRKGAEDMLAILNAGARVIFHMDRLDSSVAGHRREIINRAEEAREYSRQLGERVSDAREDIRSRGEWANGNVPYGLAKDPETGGLVPDDAPAVEGRSMTRADVAGALFHLSARGRTISRMQALLYARGILAPKGGAHWSDGTISGILNSPVYAGWQTLRSTGRGGRHAKYLNPRTGKPVRLLGRALIADSLFERARSSRAGHRIPQLHQVETPPGVAVHELTGSLYCEGCRGRMQSVGLSYVCHRDRKKTCPARASVKRTAVERYVGHLWVSAVSGLTPEDPLMHELAMRWEALKDPQSAAQSADALAAVKRAEGALGQLARDRKDGLYNGAMGRFFSTMVEEAEEALKVAQAALRAVGGGTLEIPPFAHQPEAAQEAWNAADRAARRELVPLVFRRIYVSKAPEGSNTGAAFNGQARVRELWHTDPVEAPKAA